MKKNFTLMALLILLWTTNAFAIELATATIEDVGFTNKFEYAVDIYAISEGLNNDNSPDDFELGTTQLDISFNNSVLSIPDLSSALSEQHPDFNADPYNPMELVPVADGRVQLRITHTGGAGTILPRTAIRLARITFTIDRDVYRTQNAGIDWTPDPTWILSVMHNIDDVSVFLSTESDALAGNTSLVCLPTISGTVAPATSIAVGSAYSFIPTVDNGYGTLSFDITNRPPWAAFDTTTGELSGMPTFSDVGTYNDIVIQVSDAYDAGGSVPFAIEVTADCTAPTLSGAPPATVASGTAYAFTPTVSNGCGILEFAILNLPAWADFDVATGTLSGTPEAADAGTYPGIEITVTDQQYASDSLDAFAIEVTDAGASGDPVSDPVDDSAGDVTGDSGGGGGGGCFITTLF